ncbi:hypothetical protein T11_736 [Trichinella zimbabwensis]|uniref:Uncharacterized protein n=1 Tax=Trichinella zimbabwensis TaxID=268475 RepID=A0A0V1H4E8_9BILA|nr:hypothetical protein T11_736 [Trichinella zimbabwensis]
MTHHMLIYQETDSLPCLGSLSLPVAGCRWIRAPRTSLTGAPCPFAPEAIAFTVWNRIQVDPRVLVSNTRGVVSSLGSDRVFLPGMYSWVVRFFWP